MLSLSPLVAAIAGGNAAVIKPSEVSPACAEVIAKLVPQYLDTQAFSVVEGGVPETTALLEQHVGPHLLHRRAADRQGRDDGRREAPHARWCSSSAARTRPSCTRAPTFGSRRAASRKGRWMNAGQTCTAPDHIFVFAKVEGRVFGAAQGGGGRLLRRRSAAEPGLRPHRQRAPFRPADGAARRAATSITAASTTAATSISRRPSW